MAAETGAEEKLLLAGGRNPPAGSPAVCSSAPSPPPPPPPLLPLFTLDWSGASGVQCERSCAQTQRHCPRYGSPSNAGRRTPGRADSQPSHSLRALFSFLIAPPPPLFCTVHYVQLALPLARSLPISLSLYLMCQDCLYF